MSNDALIEFGKRDDAWADQYSMFRFMFESGIEDELEKLPIYYYEPVEQAFQRPSFYIKYVNLRPIPVNHYMTWYEGAVQIQFFSEDMFEANLMKSKLLELFAPVRDVILPKYDYTVDPPEKISVTGLTPDGEGTEARMGTRIMPDTVTGRAFRESDERWQTVIGFTMRSPRLTPRDCNILRSVTRQPFGELPARVLEAGISTSTSTEHDTE
jgi:hypothetical protein